MAPKKKRRKKNPYDEYPDDIFADTRMSFGEHLEELRQRMITALKWLIFFMVIGFVLDGIGSAVGNPRIGIGKPVMVAITEPVKDQVNDFYNRRIERARSDKLEHLERADQAEIARIRKKLEANGHSLSSLSVEERRLLLGAPEVMPAEVDVQELTPAFGPPRPDAPSTITLHLRVYPGFVNYLNEKGQSLLETRQYLTTLSVQEGFVVYFKVQILCGFVLGSPFILYQFWAFVAAGLYPHEKRYVYWMLGPSVSLFLAGVLMCQFLVLPGAVKALLIFNEWLGLDPDIRLSDWFSLAIILPLVFGVSFQTPLVMVFLYRLGIFSVEDYLSKWRHACMLLAVFAAMITPTPDAVTMLYLFLPLFALYLLGIVICRLYPLESDEEEWEEAEEVAV
ncbi:MAG: twin-arginine translocase subunit TatC [Gemmataceae bacterium]|nr:twin-arginine translocase subunit TatC [Gemmataceae bacterium]MDW8244465.1 twin-arginine translocase subunit TatC [Thermogemmata sp.]